jgi:isoquinoline 1-oxidoreductase alpha subunit
MTKFELNGKEISVKSAPDTPLLWVIRDELQMTGTKFGCGMAQCGACTIHLDGVATRSCVLPIAAVAGRKVTTIENTATGAGATKASTAVVDAWRKLNVVQCGYCQSGQIMSAVALLQTNPNPDDAAIDDAMKGNICRCATYQRIRAAIKDAATTMKG